VANCLYCLLKDTNHNSNLAVLKVISKFYHYCQLKGATLRRFKFNLRDDYDFNYEIIVNIMYLNSKPVLYIVDSRISF
jgi:hypothetical protein